ncbi:MAG: 5'-3' exonuclease H3TH domain-containing protein [Polyangiales bacterium]
MTTRLHLVDGTFELFRAHYAKRPDHVDPQGRDRKATLGVAQSLLWLLEEAEEAVTHVAVAYDNPIRSFRNDLFPSYKSDEGMLPELRAQFDSVEEATRAVGVVVWSMDRWEADDALATAARKYAGDFDQVRILTPDKDLGAVLEGDRIVQIDRIRKKLIDEKSFRAARGIAPASMPDWLALVGDTADGIPGLPGIGEKTASALLAAYGHLEGIPDDAAAWTVKIRGADALAATLRERKKEALLYRTLATLAFDVPLAETKADLAYRGTPRVKFEAWCDAIGSTSMKERPKRWRD